MFFCKLATQIHPLFSDPKHFRFFRGIGSRGVLITASGVNNSVQFYLLEKHIYRYTPIHFKPIWMYIAKEFLSSRNYWKHVWVRTGECKSYYLLMYSFNRNYLVSNYQRNDIFRLLWLPSVVANKCAIQGKYN